MRSDDKLTRSAFWCGVLEGDARPVAPGAAVRTVRGAYHRVGAPEPRRRPGDCAKRASSHMRRV